MQQEIEILSRLLGNRYERVRGAVAFIDETFHYASSHDESSFYVIGAAVLPIEALNSTRKRIADLVGEGYWHTTDSFHKGDQASIRTFLREIRAMRVSNFVATLRGIPENDLEHARRVCLAQALAHLERMNTDLVVIERRDSLAKRNSDTSLFMRARATGFVKTSMQLIQGHPAAENLLWIPDLVCWAYRRFIAVGETEWLRCLEVSQAEEQSESEFRLKKKRSEPALQSSSDPEGHMGHLGAVTHRSSKTSIAQIACGEALPVHKLITDLEPPLMASSLSIWLEQEFSDPGEKFTGPVA